MIESVSRVVSDFALNAPSIFETPVMGRNFVETLWMQKRTIDHPSGIIVQITHIDSGESIYLRHNEMMTWLQPEDMNSPSVQAEIITAIAAKENN